jgi:hypothetical protein
VNWQRAVQSRRRARSEQEAGHSKASVVWRSLVRIPAAHDCALQDVGRGVLSGVRLVERAGEMRLNPKEREVRWVYSTDV